MEVSHNIENKKGKKVLFKSDTLFSTYKKMIEGVNTEITCCNVVSDERKKELDTKENFFTENIKNVENDFLNIIKGKKKSDCIIFSVFNDFYQRNHTIIITQAKVY